MTLADLDLLRSRFPDWKNTGPPLRMNVAGLGFGVDGIEADAKAGDTSSGGELRDRVVESGMVEDLGLRKEGKSM